MRVFLLCLSAWLLPIGLPALPVSHAADEVDDLLAVLVEQKDAADTELIRQLAALQSEMAFEGLLSIYSEMGSVYMRRAVLRAMASFDGNAALENKAAAKIRDVATLSESRQMRMIALEILATCRSVGKPHLASIVRSSADDELREIALRRHASLADETDLDWYRELYTGIQADQEAPRKLKKAERIRAAKKLEKEQDQASNREPHQLEVLREIAFERLLSSHSLPELQKACDERNLEIRLMAMRELEQRGPEQAFEVARRTYMNARRPAGERLLAAQIIKHAAAEEYFERFMKDGRQADQSERMAMGLADLLASYQSPQAIKESLKILGKGKGQELRFSLRLAAKIDDPKVDEVLLKVIKGKAASASVDAIEILVARGHTAALEPLKKLVLKSRSSEVIAAALGAIGALGGTDQAWGEELMGLIQHEALPIRNAAIEAMAAAWDARFLEDYLAVLEHPNWSTRLAVAEAIGRLELKAGVGALAQRMQHESGRMALEFARILFALSGKPFGTNGQAWDRWWREAGADFEIIRRSEREELERELELRQLKDTSKSSFKGVRIDSEESTFFGLQLRSQALVFIIDVSGSMEEATRGAYAGASGPLRMDVAKLELRRAIQSLGDQSYFNIIHFNDRVGIWNAELVPANEENRSSATEHSDAFVPNGGTNLYGALELAFKDQRVDTICILSDGDPSAGDVVDPLSIQRIVEGWNRERRIKFNCIAIGSDLDVLKNLSEASGGGYLEIL